MTGPVFTLTYNYSRALVRRHSLREMWGNQGGQLIGTALFLAFGIWASLNSDTWWFGGFLTGVALTSVSVLYTSYRKFDRFPLDLPITTTIADGGLRFISAVMSSEVPWVSISRVRETKDGLVLTYRLTGGSILLPAVALSKEVTEFVVHKVKQQGGGAKDGA